MTEPADRKGAAQRALASALFQQYAKELHRFLCRRVGHRQNVDDVFQTVFERVMKVPDTDLVNHPHDYLFGIAFHVVREHWIREKRRKRFVEFDSEEVERIGASLEHAQEDASAERLNLRKQIESAFASLPENHRRVMLAIKRDGMSYEEASAATGISLFMVRKLMIDAKVKLMARAWDW
jgi:RNA polymerase sigma factor (sigma-70 family)